MERLNFERMYEYFGNIHVSEITLLGLEEFQVWLKRKYQITNSTVNRQFNIFKNFLSKCEDWHFLRENPSRRLKNLRYKAPVKKIWSDDQIQQVLSLAQPWAREIFIHLALTGARRGEMARLQWKDVSFEKKMLRLVSQKGSGDERVRHIPLNQEFLDTYRRLKQEARRQFRARPEDHVFVNASGLPVSPTHITREMARLTKRLGLEKGLNLHGLRHTFCTLMATNNQSLEKIRQLAGHSSLRTTEQYLHIQDHELRQAMDQAMKTRSLKLVEQ